MSAESTDTIEPVRGCLLLEGEDEPCVCVTRWQHGFFCCKIRSHHPSLILATSDPDAELPQHDEAQEEGGEVWKYRDECWKSFMRGWEFGMGDLQKEPVTNDLYNALHQSAAILLAFLVDWHTWTRQIWMDIHEKAPVVVPSHEETCVTRGMTICNKIVGALENDGNWETLYGGEGGEEKTEKFRNVLYELVFHMDKLEMKEEGGVDGDVGVVYGDPEEVPVEEGVEVVVDDGKRDEGTQTAQLVEFDRLYDYLDAETQTEGGVMIDEGMQTEIQEEPQIEKQKGEADEEKDRHDSGVGLEMDGAEKEPELESNDEEDGGVLLSYHRMGLLSKHTGATGAEGVVLKSSPELQYEKLRGEEERRGRARTRE